MDNKLLPGQEIAAFESSKGNSVVLRTPKESDVDQMYAFINELIAEDTFILRGPEHTISHEEEVKWVQTVLSEMEKGIHIPILAFIGDKLVGNSAVTRRDKRQSHVGDFHIAILEEYREEGIGQEIMKVIIGLAKVAGIKVLLLGCFANNPRALHVYEKLGFQQYGVAPLVIQYKGELVDEVKMYMVLQ